MVDSFSLSQTPHLHAVVDHDISSFKVAAHDAYAIGPYVLRFDALEFDQPEERHLLIKRDALCADLGAPAMAYDLAFEATSKQLRFVQTKDVKGRLLSEKKIRGAQGE